MPLPPRLDRDEDVTLAMTGGAEASAPRHGQPGRD
jgi:hypothetical protein